MGILSCLFVALSGMLVIEYGGAASLQLCQSDNDCGNKKFCYAKTGLCSPCIECKAYKRHDREGSLCAKEPWQCGDCLQGYELEELLDGQLRGLCVPLSKPVAASDPQPLLKVAESHNYFLLVGVISSIVLFAAVTIALKRCMWPVKVNVRTRVGHPTSCNDSLSTSPSILHAPSAPPPPYEAVSEYKDGEEETFHGHVCEREEQKSQMASKYLDPNYVRTPNNSANNPGNNNPPPQDVVDHGPPNAGEPFLIDENTLPSSWSPGPEYEEPSPSEASAPSSSAPLITSFTGILRLNDTSGMGRQTQPEPTNHTANGDDSANAQSGPQYNVTNVTIINSASGPTGVFNITNI